METSTKLTAEFTAAVVVVVVVGGGVVVVAGAGPAHV